MDRLLPDPGQAIPDGHRPKDSRPPDLRYATLAIHGTFILNLSKLDLLYPTLYKPHRPKVEIQFERLWMFVP